MKQAAVFLSVFAAICSANALAEQVCDHESHPQIAHEHHNKYVVDKTTAIDAVYFFENDLALDGDSEAERIEKRINDSLVRAGARVRVSVINGGPRAERAEVNGANLFEVFENERQAGTLDGYEADLVIFRADRLVDANTGAELAGSASSPLASDKIRFFRLSNRAADSTAAHEFGHVLTLGHSDGFTCAGESDVMRSAPGWSDRLFYVSGRYSIGGQPCGRNGAGVDDVDVIEAQAPAAAALFPNAEPTSFFSLSAPSSVSEGHDLEVTVTRAGDLSEPASVRVRVISNESATSQIAEQKIVTFAPGESVKTDLLSVPSDDDAEAEERAFVLLDDAVGAGYSLEVQQSFAIAASQAPASGVGSNESSGGGGGGGGGGSVGLLGLLFGGLLLARRK